MTKIDIDLMLQEFHDQLHIPLLDATTEAYRQGTPESLSDAIKMLHLSAVALEGIILSVERSDSLREDQELIGEVTQSALSLEACKDELSDLLAQYDENNSQYDNDSY
ncbi:hypothetical protein WCE19_17550 [Enterobacter cloacae]|uniref:hypothetical protein n=1 Tax=Enterobacter cloacae TaxID=550 RepID=UPI0034D450C6